MRTLGYVCQCGCVCVCVHVHVCVLLSVTECEVMEKKFSRVT